MSNLYGQNPHRWPLSALRRALRPIKRRYLRWSVRGSAVECPCCGGTFEQFLPDWNRPDAVCAGCGSHERHRMLRLWLGGDPALLRGKSLLHFAPERCLEGWLRRAQVSEYTTSNLVPRRRDISLDLNDLDLPDDRFDSILLSHVLEHLEDDRGALRELRRVLRPSGQLIVMVPVDHSRRTTYEDPTVIEPADRQREFRQFDHVRLYAADVAQRLAGCGFEVTTIAYARQLGEEACHRYGLSVDDEIYVCVK